MHFRGCKNQAGSFGTFVEFKNEMLVRLFSVCYSNNGKTNVRGRLVNVNAETYRWTCIRY